jgi:macrolide transport system ATP-binding/permease protein
MSIIQFSNLYKIYNMGGVVQACSDINLSVEKGEFLVIMGASGSGKSTMMNIIGCLDRPTSGTYMLDGMEVSLLSDDELASIRNRKIGFIFQKFHLLPGISALENVELPMIYSGVNSSDREKISKKSLRSVGLEGRIDHNPNELSGGQMQRVAIARALVNNPPIILADEPTGNLDTKSGGEIMALFQELHSQGRTIILITHNSEMALYGTRVLKLQDGKIISDEYLKESERIIINNGAVEKTITSTLTTIGSMNIFKSFKIAWNALKVNKLRSLLTMLGIIIGVSAVIVMTSIGEGTKYSVTQEFSSLGTNLIYLRGGDARSVIGNETDSEARKITFRDVDALKNHTFSYITGVAPQTSHTVSARYLASTLSTTLIGTTPDYYSVKNLTLQEGRFFSTGEMNRRAPVCVIGSKVVEKLFNNSEDIIGKTVKLTFSSEGSGSRLVIIGILEKKGKTFGQDPDNQILIPLTTMSARFFEDKYLQTIYLQGKDSDSIDYAIDEVKKVLLPLHKNNPGNFNLESQEEMLNTISTTLSLFTYMLGGIAFISLIVGGIGIMNIMLVSVTERTREIGLRKAIGAKRGDILVQFLIESLVLGITGGIIGIAIGMLLAECYTLIASYSNLGVMSKTIVSIQAILISFSFSAIIGVFFGIYPARKAASLNPIDALRYE